MCMAISYNKQTHHIIIKHANTWKSAPCPWVGHFDIYFKRGLWVLPTKETDRDYWQGQSSMVPERAGCGIKQTFINLMSSTASWLCNLGQVTQLLWATLKKNTQKLSRYNVRDTSGKPLLRFYGCHISPLCSWLSKTTGRILRKLKARQHWHKVTSPSVSRITHSYDEVNSLIERL